MSVAIAETDTETLQSSEAIEPPEAIDSDRPKPAKVVDSTRWYSLNNIEFMFGTDVAVRLRDDWKQGSPIFTQNRGGECVLIGAQISVWLEKRCPEAVVTDHWARIYRKTHRPPPTPPPEPEPSVLEKATAKVREWNAAEQSDEHTFRERMHADYLSILQRMNAPEGDDVERLASIMATLGIDAARVAADEEVVAKAQKLHAQHSDREAAHAKGLSARQELRATEQRHKAELEAAEKASRHAKSYAGDCNNAAQLLLQLSRGRPQLFDTTADPPQLRKPVKDTTTKGKTTKGKT